MQLDRLRPVFEHPGPYLTIHAEVGRTSEDALDQLDARWTTIRHELERKELDDAIIAELEHRLREKPYVSGEARRTIVVAGEDVVLDEVQPGHAQWPESLDLADLPDLRGWLRAADAEVPFLLVRIDRTGGDIDLYRAVASPAVQHESVEGAEFYITKVPRGDWAHTQHQRGAEELWKRNAGKVADALRSLIRRERPEVVLVAGDLRAVEELVEALGRSPVPIVKLESGGRAAGTSIEALHDEMSRVLAEFEARRHQEVLERLEEAAGRGQGEAASGVPDVLDALVRGQVDSLVIDLDRTAEQSVRPDGVTGLPLPVSVTRREEQPADRVLVAAAALSGAELVVLPAEVAEGQTVAALLRWSA